MIRKEPIVASKQQLAVFSSVWKKINEFENQRKLLPFLHYFFKLILSGSKTNHIHFHEAIYYQENNKWIIIVKNKLKTLTNPDLSRSNLNNSTRNCFYTNLIRAEITKNLSFNLILSLNFCMLLNTLENLYLFHRSQKGIENKTSFD